METSIQTYVNPLSDWGFKRLFGTEMNKDLLLEFLRGLFPEREIRDRALYYAAHPIIEQGCRGGWNYRLNPVCVVGVLDFAMEHDYGGESERWRDKLVHRYRLREDETGEIMNSKLEFLYLEVGAYRREVTERSGIVEKWMYVLKNLSRLEGRPPELRERVFERLFEAARIAAYTREERNQYESDMMNENDYRNTIEYAREAGLAEGEAKGKAEVARNMLASGMLEEQVMAMTGLTAEQLAALK